MDKNKKFVRVIDIVFCLIFGVGIVIGGVVSLSSSKKVSEYENRPSNQFVLPSVESFMEGDFQESVEASFSDQIPLSQTMKRTYNSNVSSIKIKLNQKIISQGETYYPFAGAMKFKDHIVFGVRKASNETEALEKRIQNINNLVKNNTGVEFFVYYIEKDTDLDFESGEKNGFFDYLIENLNLRPENIERFEMNSFDDFATNFYKTDHHWNYKGSYKGYAEVIAMMAGESESVIQRGEEVCLSSNYSGSKASQAGVSDVFKEDFTVYPFNFPTHTTRINGELREYGRDLSEYPQALPTLGYGDYYGSDEGLVHFDFNKPDKKNLLIVGESYDNPIIKLIASHFNNTYSVDLRNYDENSFDFLEFKVEHDIDSVLLIGNIDFFVLEAFNIR